MLIYDYRILRGRIREKFGTQAKFAKTLEIGDVSLSKRLNSKVEFQQDEILKAARALEISEEEIPKYFFQEKV